MIRIAGVLALLLTLYAALFLSDRNAVGWENLQDVANRQGRLGVETIGVAVLIITGAIDLSIGSVMGLASTGFGVLTVRGTHPYIAFVTILLGGAAIGCFHGLLVTRLKLQPFLVTLCGMFVWRGLARYMGAKAFEGKSVGLTVIRDAQPEFQGPIESLRYALIGKNADSELVFPAQFIVMLLIATTVGLMLHSSVFGRYCYAIGHNEQAARYAGIRTPRYRLAGFTLCSMLAAFAGMLALLDVGSASPTSAGEGEELYAITGAVLGGCSLHGGEGTIFGIVLGACVLPLLRNLVVFAGASDELIPVIIGMTLLLGTLTDEYFRRRAARRK